jgi:4-hydroxybenzoate polyprenyltransferase
MLAGLKIIAGVVVYRLRRLEMANLAAAVSIAVALRLPWVDVACRTLFAFVLNVLVYLNNDYIDIGLDLRSFDKDAKKSRFLADHLREALVAQWLLLALLVVAAILYDPGLLVPIVVGGGVCFWYTAQLKHRLYLDILAMTVWGAAMPLCGTPISSTLGVCLALQLGLFSAVFETIQLMRDNDEDEKGGVPTTSVVLGKTRTLALARILMLCATLYALLVMHPIVAAISLGVLAIPFDPNCVDRYWTRVKLVYGAAWLALCAWLFWQAHSAGLLLSIDHAASYD